MSNRRTWAEYRKLQRIVVVVWGASFLVLFILLLLPSDWWARLSRPLFAVALVWGFVLAFFALRLSYWPCPCCGKLFFLRFGVFPSYSKKCPHCGLAYPG